jgi:molecular chaperone GrpE (heat shock protein)
MTNPDNTSECVRPAAFQSRSSGQPADGHVVADGRPKHPLEVAFDTVVQYLLESQTWRDQVAARLDNISRTVAANAEGLRVLLQTIERIEAQMQKLAQESGAQAHNLEQVRVQGEALARNFEKVSQEFIERQVMDPFLVTFARLHELVALDGRNNGTGVGGLQTILHQIEGHLQNHGVELVIPQEGDPFNPRKHQPVQQVLTTDQAMHGRIALTFNTGLVQGQRVILPARVGLYMFAGPCR